MTGYRKASFSILLSAFAVGCAPTPSDVNEVSEPIAWGQDDIGSSPSNQLMRDVVVRLSGRNGRCSGTLLTPRLVLTASHCVRGDDASGVHDDAPNVFIGLSKNTSEGLTAAIPYPGETAVSAYIDRPVNVERRYEIATDVALVRLPAALNFTEKALIMSRPSFDSPQTGSAEMAGFASENIGPNGNRQVGSAELERIDVDDARYFEMSGGSAIRHGDSGGPLFVTRDNGSRDIIGVNSAGPKADASRTGYHADITSLLMSNWIKSAAQDRSRTSKWLAQHGRSAGNYWLGEVDYTGPCSSSVDVDCDHWTNDHDNCPVLANLDQADGNDNVIGDACEAPYTGPFGTPSGHIRSSLNGKVLDSHGVISADSVPDMQPWTLARSQVWVFEADGTIHSYVGGACLDVRGARQTPGARVDLETCWGAANQKWDVGRDGTVRNRFSGLCLEVAGSNSADGATLQQATCTGADNQRWTL